MLDLPAHFAGLILAFAPLFVHRSWRHAQILLVGAILTPGRRTVTSVLRIMGRAQERRFVNVHRILNRAAWCPRSGSRILLGLLVDAFAQRGPRGPGAGRHDRAPSRQADRGQGHLP
jgi:DDE superfamily endonuclease